MYAKADNYFLILIQAIVYIKPPSMADSCSGPVARKRAKRLKQKAKRKIRCKRKLFDKTECLSRCGATACQAVEPLPVPSGVNTPPITPEPALTWQAQENFYSAESSDEDDQRWKDYREEHAKMRRAAREKQLSLAFAYGTHIDSSPAIEESNSLLPNAINKLSPVDRITIRRHVGDLKDKERQAINLARLYRTQNAKLKQTCLDLRSNALKRERVFVTFGANKY